MGSELPIDSSHFKLEGNCKEEFRWSAKLLPAGGVIRVALAQLTREPVGFLGVAGLPDHIATLIEQF